MSLTLKNMSVKPGKDLKITGVPKPDAEGFSVNIGHSDNDIALHFNVRFNQHGDHHAIVFNSRQGGSWCNEQREDHFPFEQGEEFKVTINYNSDEFHVKMPGDHTVLFPNRFGEDKFMYIEVLGDVKIKGFKIN
ncbi:lectin, galactoside-binding, soluble, 2b [Paramormyrops kingsleyae]|uniref:Galectin n=1 Tax=Paramormyrops kingsleyae TaxID=1676925 RepID=A0A3B3SU69_9TELE|nr:beta-galactoside-binding lectin-like [Paramormyrops kingsleyae]